MSLANASIVTAPTSIAASGGSALPFSSLGPVNAGQVVLAATADTDLRTRRLLKCTAKPPTVLSTAPNGYTQAKTETLYVKPKLLANGKITANTVQVTVKYDVETTQTEIQELLDVGAQICCDSDFTAYHKTLNLS